MGLLAYSVERFIYTRADMINVLTPAFYKVLLERKDIKEDKLIMVPNAADFTLSEAVIKDYDREQYNSRKNPKYLGRKTPTDFDKLWLKMI